MRIRTKLVLSFSLVAFLGLSVFALVIFQTFADNLSSYKERFFMLKTKGVEERLSDTINLYIHDLELFSVRYADEAFKGTSVSHRHNGVEKSLTLYLQEHSQFDSIILASTDGSIILVRGQSDRLSIAAHEMGIKIYDSSGNIRPAVFADMNDMFIGVPFDGKNGQGRQLFLMARVRTDILRKIINEGLELPGTYFVVSSNGELLFTCCRMINGDPSPEVKEIAGKSGGGGVIQIGSGPEFARLHVFTVPLHFLGWNLSFAVPNQVYASEITSFRNRIAAAVLIVTWISIWVILIVAYRISRPIIALSHASKNITDFDAPSQPAPTYTTDEIGELARNFEAMRMQLKDLVVYDSLTGVYNRRYLMNAFDAEMKRSCRIGDMLVLLILDVDHFKEINDTYGHQCGDEVLKELATLMKANVRDYDIVGRYGGEEFVIVLPSTPRATGYEIAERIRNGVESMAVHCSRGALTCTISIGIATLDETNGNVETLFNHADTALYEAKNTGRNRSVLYGV